MQGKKIIIAESSSTIRSVADSLLRQHGYDVVCTSDGLQAWEVIQAEKPDLVLVGLNLSGLPGLEVCRQMSGDRVAGGIPSLLMIGAKDRISDDQVMASGARGHLKKPFSPKDLLDAVSRLIGPGRPEAAETKGAGKLRTKYDVEMMSSTGLAEKDSGKIHNLSWVDLDEVQEDSGEKAEKVATIDAESDDQGLIIEEDQFGLISGKIHGQSEETRTESNDEEDYEWFIGEMQKEVAGGGADNVEKQKASVNRPASEPARDSDEHIGFDDLGSKKPAAKTRNSESAQRSSKRRQEAVSKGGQRAPLTEAEIAEIAEQVTRNLAESIVAKLDRRVLIDAIMKSLDSR